MRKRIAWTALAVLFSMPGVKAADFSGSTRREPVAAPVNSFNWTGVYLGVNGGYGTSAVHEDVVDFPFSSEINASGGLVGGHVGFNWQISPMFLIGVEGEGDWANISNSGLKYTTDGVYHEIYSKTNWLADVSGRLGFTIDRTLIYGKGGVAWAGLNYDSIIGRKTYAIGESANSGWVVGGGVETFIAPNWSMKVEYDHYDFGSNRYHITDVPLTVEIDALQTVDVVKVGLSYKFGAQQQPLPPLK